jgi:hypothetical protein
MFNITQDMADIVRLQRTWATKVSDNSVGNAYGKSCMDDFNSIVKALPVRSNLKILDIGAGLGGIDILLHNYYSNLGHPPKIFLLDKNKVDENIKYGYSNTPSAYNNLSLAEQFFHMNNIPVEDCRFVTEYPKVTFDIIISLISCGFHYPISEYISYIKHSIHTKTVVIMDIRKFSGQFDTLHNTFNWVNCLQVTQKYKRIVCRL